MVWNSEKARYAVAAAIGVVVFVLVGFFAYSIERGPEWSYSLTEWLAQPLRFGVFWWAVLGAVVGAAYNFLLSKRLDEMPPHRAEGPSEAEKMDGYGEMSDEERQSRLAAIVGSKSSSSRT